jgi:hypothetical protein
MLPGSASEQHNILSLSWDDCSPVLKISSYKEDLLSGSMAFSILWQLVTQKLIVQRKQLSFVRRIMRLYRARSVQDF